MKKLLLVLAVGMMLALNLGSACAVELFRIPTELIWYDKAKTADGYVFHWPMKETSATYDDPVGTLYLIDMEGYVVQTWPGIGNNPFLYPDGMVRNGESSCFTEMDWTGKKTCVVPNANGRRIWNKKLKQYTYFGGGNYDVTKEEIVAAGGDPSLPYTGITAHQMTEWDKTGTIIWRFRHLDHVVQDKNPAWPNYVGSGKSIKDYPHKRNLFHGTDSSAARGGVGIHSDWDHANSQDYNEELDYFVHNTKQWSEFYVIDHGNTFVPGDPAASIKLAAGPKGDYLWRFGKPSAYGQGLPPGFQTEGNQQQYGEHHIQWIRPYAWERPHPEAGDTWTDPAAYDHSTVADYRLPGAGNILSFNNGVWDPVLAQSEILEINPYIKGVTSKGVTLYDTKYVNPPDAGYKSNGKSNQIVWMFRSILPNSFFAQSQSGMWRLPNGNTHVHSGNNGHIFQVDQAGDVVWEYINPVSSYDDRGYLIQSEYNPEPQSKNKTFSKNGREFDEHRSLWYPKNYPAFKDKDMSQKGTITGRTPSPLGPGPGGSYQWSVPRYTRPAVKSPMFSDESVSGAAITEGAVSGGGY